MKNYVRNEYGELSPVNSNYEIWVAANNLISRAVKSKKVKPYYNTISFDRRHRASGSARHHEIYDIYPDPLSVLLCVRETAGSKYGVCTRSKTYYLLKKHGIGVRVLNARKSVAAKAAKNAGCELGCAIAVVMGHKKLQLNRACADGIAYKKLAVGDDGRLYSIYDGSTWTIGQTRYDRALQDHNGGLYVYENVNDAINAKFPRNSVLKNSPMVVTKCRVAGNYCRYGEKLAFSHVTPINVEVIL